MQRLSILGLVLTMLLVSGCATRRALKTGDQHRLGNRPNQALLAYEKALARKPKLADDAEFMAKYEWAKSRDFYERGERNRARGEWESAVRDFDAALSVDPAFERARTASNATRIEGANACFAGAKAYAEDGDAKIAESAIRRALSLYPEHREARVANEYFIAPEQGPGGVAYVKGLGERDAGGLGEARELLSEALTKAPLHLPARAELAEVRRDQKNARSLAKTAARQLGQRDLEGANVAVSDALRIWPRFDEAIAVNGRIQKLRELAQSKVDRGVELLREGKLDAAVGAFEEGRGVNVSHPAVARGISDCYAARGDCARREGRIGAAYLEYLRARGELETARVSTQLRESRNLLDGRNVIGVSLTSAGGRLDEELRSGVVNGMQFPIQVVTNDPEARQCSVRVLSSEFTERVVRSESRSHRYEIRELHPNPKLPRLRRDLEGERRELHRMRAAFAHACHHCSGSGKGPTSNNGAYSNCGRCSGRGHGASLSRDGIRRQERRVERLRCELEQAPSSIEVCRDAYWPYIVETVELRGDLRAEVGLMPKTGGVAELLRYTADTAATDRVTLQANPAVGVAIDPLVLPAPEILVGDNLAEIAHEAVVDLRARLLREAERELSSRMKDSANQSQRIELGVDRLVLLEAMSLPEAQRVRDRLMKEVANESR